MGPGQASPSFRSGPPSSCSVGPALGATSLTVRLPFRKPFGGPELLSFLTARAVVGIESTHREAGTGSYERSLRLPHANATCLLAFGSEAILATLHLEDIRDIGSALQRCRRLLDLDSDPLAVLEALGGDPVLGGLVAKVPGLRVPGHVDGFEVVIRAIVGQQVSVAGARTTLGKITHRYGRELSSALIARSPSLTHLFPTAEALAEADPLTLGVPRSRGATIVRVAESFATGRIAAGIGANADETVADLLREKGIGPWTATYVRLRAFGDADCFLPTDLGVKHAFARLGLASDEASIVAMSESWRPWRSYALMHLWNSL